MPLTAEGAEVAKEKEKEILEPPALPDIQICRYP
jgi:hypothetical protein